MRERQETREAKPGLSDDDKIRLQLYVDVHFLLEKLREIGAIDQVILNLLLTLLVSSVKILRTMYFDPVLRFNRCSMPSKAQFFITPSAFQDVKTQESISNVVDVAVANFIKDVQNL